MTTPQDLLNYKLLKVYTYMKEIEMDSLNNRVAKAPTTHLLPPSETSSARNGLQITELLIRGVSWKLPNNSGYSQTIGYSLQTDGKALLLKTIPTYLIEE